MKQSFLVLSLCAALGACSNSHTIPITQPTPTPLATATPRPTPIVTPTPTPLPSPTPGKQVAFFAYYASHGVLPAKAGRRTQDGIPWKPSRLVYTTGISGGVGGMTIQAIDGSGNPLPEPIAPILSAEVPWFTFSTPGPSYSGLFPDAWSAIYSPYNGSHLENDPQTHTVTAAFPDVTGTATIYQYDGFQLACGYTVDITSSSGLAVDTTASGSGDIEMTNCGGSPYGDINFPYGYMIYSHTKVDPWGSPFTYFTYVTNPPVFMAQGTVLPSSDYPGDEYNVIIYKDANASLHKLMIVQETSYSVQMMQLKANSSGAFPF